MLRRIGFRRLLPPVQLVFGSVLVLANAPFVGLCINLPAIIFVGLIFIGLRLLIPARLNGVAVALHWNYAACYYGVSALAVLTLWYFVGLWIDYSVGYLSVRPPKPTSRWSLVVFAVSVSGFLLAVWLWVMQVLLNQLGSEAILYLSAVVFWTGLALLVLSLRLLRSRRAISPSIRQTK